MANPPFNVDLVDAERIKGDPRLPFGLPGVNKHKKVSNGNYLWISYFWSYLNEKGRAGFVMSSQASSAGHGEKEVRRKIVETGAVDVMISIRSNFFYTRTVPCELWFFDRAKGSVPSPPKGERARVRGPNTVLMLDARNVYRKVTRKIYDFSPEQMHNLAAIVWLYRGQWEQFLALVKDYLGRVCAESAAIPAVLATFETTLADLRGRFDALAKAVAKQTELDADKKQALADAVSELREAATLYEADAKNLLHAIGGFVSRHSRESGNPDNDAQHAASKAFDPIAEAIRGLVKQVDLLYKLAARVADLGVEISLAPGNGADGRGGVAYDRRATAKLVKQLDEERKAAVEQLKHAVYFHRQVAWLQDRFPKAELQAVPGLVKLVDRPEIEAADWSLTPGRYVGVAPPEEDEDFDFEQTLRDIHTELADLNKEAAELAAKIQENFEELGA
jgi:type I restriction enzyme M protein